MGIFVSTFIPYDATGRAVNLDTEYMYRYDGLKLKVIRFDQAELDLQGIIRKLENLDAE